MTRYQDLFPEQGKKIIEAYAISASETSPDLSNVTKTSAGSTDLQEIEIASASDISNLVDENDPLNYNQIESVEQILEHTNILESFNVDEDAMQFYLDYSVDELWKCAFKNENETVRLWLR